MNIRESISRKLQQINNLLIGKFTEETLDKIDDTCYDIIELTKICRKYIRKE